MSTYTVVVAAHIIAVVAAYGLPLSAPLLVPYVRRHHPEALNGLHAAQYRLNNAVTGPFTVLVLAFGIYLASDGDRWGDPFVSIGVGAIAIIAVVGGAVVVPAVKRLAALDPSSAEYAAVYRRYMASESFLGVVVLVTIFAMAAKPFS
ncbi:MAG TPA: hypothetical protein VI300_20745 [Solirubrobacter sp.]